MNDQETYYELLKVHPKATVSEIVQAYHTAKNAFSPDSMATYSLLDAGESKAYISKLEEAYSVLSNLEKRRQYDSGINPNAVPVAAAPTIKQPDPLEATGETNTFSAEEAEVSFENLSGGILKAIRTKKGISLEDVARITKIPARYVTYMENNQMDKLPAKVYVQGFIKNLASLYKLDPQKTARSYMDFQSKKTSEMQAPEVNKSSK